jgi:hypothetical protein
MDLKTGFKVLGFVFLGLVVTLGVIYAGFWATEKAARQNHELILAIRQDLPNGNMVLNTSAAQ